MDYKRYNYLGEDIANIKIELDDLEYGYVDENNIPHINWRKEDDIVDSDGFDKRHRPFDGLDTYVIENYILPKGLVICRYGFPRGYFTTIKGTSYETLGLPYKKKTIEYHEYKVTEDLQVDCYVTKGIIAPMFNSAGGGIQFKHKQTIYFECEDGLLQEDFSWIQKNI